MANQNKRPIAIVIFLIFLACASFSPARNLTQPQSIAVLDKSEVPGGLPSAAFQVDGLPVNTSTGDQNYPKICSDGQGGVITIWSTDGEDFIYAQRINAIGDKMWGDGKFIAAGGINAEMVSDGSGGAYIIWREANYDVKAQRIDSDGNELWTSGGIAAYNLGYYTGNLQLVSDSQGGMVVGWGDSRSEAFGSMDIYAQRLNSSGDAQWAANGTAVAVATLQQTKLKIIADGAGNSYFACGKTGEMTPNITTGGMIFTPKSWISLAFRNGQRMGLPCAMPTTAN